MAPESLTCDLATGHIRSGDIDLRKLDLVLVKKIGAVRDVEAKARIGILTQLADAGVTIASDPRAIGQVLNRIDCTLRLQQNGIPMPPTLLTECIDDTLDAVETWRSVVIKPPYSTKARGMLILNRQGTNQRAKLRTFQEKHQVFYVQKILDIGPMDYGLAFLGGLYIGAYARVRGHGGWSTTTAEGGRYAPFQASAEHIELAHRAQAPFSLDFTCVDLALTADGPVIFEVSAFGGFRGLREAQGIDAADLFVEYAMARPENVQAP